MKNKTRLPHIFLWLVMLLMYLPIAIVIIYSFNESKLTSIWSGFSFKWYRELFYDKSMFLALKNSLVLGITSSLAAGIIGTLGAVGMSKMPLKSNNIIAYISSLPIMIPEIILGMVFLTFFSLIGLPFGMTTLIIAHTTFCIPYVFMLVKARLVGVDKSYIEAAKDLGASETRAFFDITLPIIFPAVLSGMLLSFAMSFDDVIISIFVTGANVTTLPIKIYTQLKTGVSPKINALCSIIFAVTVIIVVIATLINKKIKIKGENQ